MAKYKVCVYAICKNEEKFVYRWMDSMREADQVVVTDTGSTDGTVRILKEQGAVVFQEKIEPWRFDKGRNRSLEHVPEDVDICVCTDLDEYFNPGWREALEAAWTDTASMGHYLYNWDLNPDGTPRTQFTYFKVHTRREYRWMYPAHECLKYTGAGVPQTVFIPGMVLNHEPDPDKERGSYLALLEMGAAELPNDSRMAYYLGREYAYKGRWQECVMELKRYLSLPSSLWIDERSAAMRLIARSYFSMGDHAAAESWCFRAIGEQPAVREPYVAYAQMAYTRQDWPAVYHMTDRALAITEKSADFVNEGQAWDHTPHDLAAIACYHLGLMRQAEVHARAALAHAPRNERLQNNLRLIAQKEEGEAENTAL